MVGKFEADAKEIGLAVRIGALNNGQMEGFCIYRKFPRLILPHSV